MSSSVRWSWRFRVLVAMALLAAHVLLTPYTAYLLNTVPHALRQRWAARQTEKYLGTLHQARQPCREALLPCVVALRDVLAKRDIKLRVILRPEFVSLLNADGTPRREAEVHASATLALENSLKKERIITVNLLSALHRQTCLENGAGIIAEDGAHYTKGMVELMARTVEQSMTDHQRSREGRHLMLVGDCYAYSIASELQKNGVLPHARSLFKNAGDNLMAHQLARVPPESLENVREVYWILAARHMTTDAQTPLPLPQPQAPGEASSEDERTVMATLSRVTKVPANLGKGSPYANALILHQFNTKGGESILAVTDLMSSHVVNEAVRYWLPRNTFILTLRPWDKAVTAEPRLDLEQMFDDIGDFTSERFYISDWTHAPVAQP